MYYTTIEIKKRVINKIKIYNIITYKDNSDFNYDITRFYTFKKNNLNKFDLKK